MIWVWPATGRGPGWWGIRRDHWGPEDSSCPCPRLPLSPTGPVGHSGPMGQCHPPVPSYRRGRRDQKDPPLRRQTSPPLPPHPWDRPLPWVPWIPLDLCRHGDPRHPWDPGAQSGCPRVREVRGVPADRPLRPCPRQGPRTAATRKESSCRIPS
ncbi:surface protein [Frog virus 3]|uniref:Surface protein n=1 Tax=Frog virus 3 TaxID=10493 RepID=A0A5B8P457_FRG3V|nr:surface protein [Frog virus 3]